MMAEVPKTVKELREMGVVYTFGTMVNEWQIQNELGCIEMIALLQDYQNFLINQIIHKCREGEE